MKGPFVVLVAMTAVSWSTQARASEEACLIVDEVEKAARATLTPTGPNPDAAKQVQAPSGAQAGVSPVDAPSLVGLLGVAVDNNLVAFGEGEAVTVTLSPFAFATAFHPEKLEDQAWYESEGAEWMRRFEGALTLGGKGDLFDRNGDGKVDPPPATENLADSIAWEVRFRVWGSRDRRENGFQKIAMAAAEPFVTEVSEFTAFIERHFKGQSCATARKTLANPDAALRQELVALALLSEKTQKEMQQAFAKHDRHFILTAFASGVRREDFLGPDKTAFGLRAGWGLGPLDHTFNFDWSRQEEDAAGRRPRFIKLGYAANMRPAPRRAFDPKLALFAAWERYEDVPDAKHRTVAKVGGKVELTVAQGVKLPLTVTWANHRDLIEGANEFIGHVGISLDLSELGKAGNQ